MIEPTSVLLRRRSFLTWCGSAGLGSTLFPGALWAQSAGGTATITMAVRINESRRHPVPRYVKDLIGLDTSAFCVTDKYDFACAYSKVSEKRRATRAIVNQAAREQLFDAEPVFAGIV